MSEQVGEAWIDVHADGSGLPGEIRRIAAGAAAGAKIEIDADVDTKGLVAKVQAAAAAAEKAAKIQIEAELESTRLKAAAAALKKGGTITYQAEVDARSLSAQAGAFTRRARLAEKLKVEAVADFKPLYAQLGALRRQLEAVDKGIKIPVEVETGGASASLAATKARLQAQAGEINIPVKMDVDRNTLSRSISGALSGLGGIVSRFFQQAVGKGSAIGNFGTAIATVVRFGLAQFAILAVAAAAAAPYVAAIATMVGQMAFQLANAAIAAGAFAAVSFASVAVGIGVVQMATTGLSESFAAMAPLVTANARGLKATAEQTKAYQDSLRGLAPSAKQFVETIFQLSGAWTEMTRSVQGAVFDNVGAQLARTAGVIRGPMQSGLTAIGGTINNLINRFLRWAATDKAVGQLTSGLKIVDDVISDLGRAAGDFGTGLLDLFVGAGPNARAFGDMFRGLGKDFRGWVEDVTAGGKNSKLNKFLTDARGDFGLVWRSMKAIGGIATGFWKALTGGKEQKGGSLLQQITEGLEGASEWFGKEENQKAIGDWLKDAKKLFDDFVKFLGQVGTILAGLVKGDYTITIKVLFELFPINPDEAIADWLRDLWGKLGEALKNLPQGSVPKGGPKFSIPVTPELGPMPPMPTLPPIPWPIEPKVGSADRPNLPTLPWPIVPDVRGVPRINLPPIPWPIIPKVGPIPKINLPTIPWPVVPKVGPIPRINLPPIPWPIEIKPPSVPSIPLPKLRWPSEIQPPSIPPVQLPGLRWPSGVDLPSIPSIQLPGLRWPSSVDPPGIIPNIPLPELHWPSVIDPPEPPTLTPPDPLEIPLDYMDIAPLSVGGDGGIPTPGKVEIPLAYGAAPSGQPEVRIDAVKIPLGFGETPDQPDMILQRVNIPLGFGPLPPFPNISPPPIRLTFQLGAIPAMPRPRIVIPVSFQVGAFPAIPRPRVVIPVSFSIGPFPSIPKPRVVVPINFTRGPFPAMPKPRISVPVTFAKGPFPAMPRPRIVVPISFVKGPFPAMPSPKITVPVNFSVGPLNLPNPPDITVNVRYNKVGSPAAKGMVAMAGGGIGGIAMTQGPTLALIGESGPEAVVPLTRTQPLDPAVLSLLRSVASDRGLLKERAADAGPLAVVQVTVPTEDPEAAAMAVMNRLALELAT